MAGNVTAFQHGVDLPNIYQAGTCGRRPSRRATTCGSGAWRPSFGIAAIGADRVRLAAAIQTTSWTFLQLVFAFVNAPLPGDVSLLGMFWKARGPGNGAFSGN